ncbi:hypothetical protein [Dyadobacter sediminis]|uniref:Uncharacterized protein n=1 Tax=Dyadobacter sediminis TaxID=1493691 RepID=A0A5R9K7M5_9BACT|nr:hypothetical protein [Dyadobacter sediminis]TLU89854.1 hypothetical protein FEM55_20195 [Dyadobacter sediminis]
MLAQIQRVNNLTIDIPDLVITTLADSAYMQHSDYPDELGKQNWKILLTGKEEATDVMEKLSGSCQDDLHNMLVLVDKDGYTRGYYKGADPEDSDRLMAEIKILQYEYKNSTH